MKNFNPKKTQLVAHKNGNKITLQFGYAFFSAKRMATELETAGWVVALRRFL